MNQYEFKQGVIKQSRSLPDTDMVGLFCVGTLCPPWLGMRKKILPLLSISWGKKFCVKVMILGTRSASTASAAQATETNLYCPKVHS